MINWTGKTSMSCVPNKSPVSSIRRFPSAGSISTRISMPSPQSGPSGNGSEQFRVGRATPAEEHLEVATTRPDELAKGKRLGRHDVLGDALRIPVRAHLLPSAPLRVNAALNHVATVRCVCRHKCRWRSQNSHEAPTSSLSWERHVDQPIMPDRNKQVSHTVGA
jgi:hypothetical protein